MLALKSADIYAYVLKNGFGGGGRVSYGNKKTMGSGMEGGEQAGQEGEHVDEDKKMYVASG